MIEFSKAHACGNDFLIVEAQHVAGRDLPALTGAMCARTTGIGADRDVRRMNISAKSGCVSCCTVWITPVA